MLRLAHGGDQHVTDLSAEAFLSTRIHRRKASGSMDGCRMADEFHQRPPGVRSNQLGRRGTLTGGGWPSACCTAMASRAASCRSPSQPSIAWAEGVPEVQDGPEIDSRSSCPTTAALISQLPLDRVGQRYWIAGLQGPGLAFQPVQKLAIPDGVPYLTTSAKPAAYSRSGSVDSMPKSASTALG